MCDVEGWADVLGAKACVCVNGHIQTGSGCMPLNAEYVYCLSNSNTLHGLLAAEDILYLGIL